MDDHADSVRSRTASTIQTKSLAAAIAMPKAQPATPPPVPDHLLEYRRQLVAAEQKAQEDFDKTVLSLSGGALGISFVFLKDVIGANPISSPGFLLAAWICWGSSTLSILTSYYMSQMALRRAIRDTDQGQIYGRTPGGHYAKATAALNATGAILFFAGVLCIVIFAGHNFPTKVNSNDRPKVTTTPATPATSAVTATNANTDTGGTERPDNRGLYPTPAPSAAAK